MRVRMQAFQESGQCFIETARRSLKRTAMVATLHDSSLYSNLLEMNSLGPILKDVKDVFCVNKLMYVGELMNILNVLVNLQAMIKP